MRRIITLDNLNNTTMRNLMMGFLMNIGETLNIEETAQRLMSEYNDTVTIERNSYTLTSKNSHIGEKRLSICYTDEIEKIDNAIDNFQMEVAAWEDHLANCYESQHEEQ